jgi:arabinogalactan oligomer / maltooligosaccharide transport system substrate-binding protein/arabinogalactan oligomer / maltooligosaccharide transport system permease protein
MRFGRLFSFLIALSGLSCAMRDDPNRIVIWHQMRVDERLILEGQMRKFMRIHPDVRVEAIYKETEELRSGFIIAAIAGQGPELVYGPSDQVGPFQVMDIIKPLETLFDTTWLREFNPKGLTWYKGHLYQIADKLGNHLTLVYNKKLVRDPPRTDEELVALGKKLTKDLNGDGKIDQYALTWNYTEPFFFIPFMTGFGGWIMDEQGNPTLDNPGTVGGLRFIKELRDTYRIIPAEADYEIADALFKDGKAAMIINGDWSWSGYRKAGIDIGVAPLPKITSTGLWCAPMVSPKGYSVNENVSPEKLRLVGEFLRFILEPDNQKETAQALETMPTWKSLYDDPAIRSDEILINSERQIELGKPMPVVPELRAIWDAMRPSYQAVLGGAKTAEQAARDMQKLALQKIAEMNE